jgi:hypothetical protein
MHRQRKGKTKTLSEHTERRLEERYGLRYTQLLRDTLLHQVHSGKASLVKKQSLRVSIWDGTYEVRTNDILDSNRVKPGPIRIRYAYDKHRKTLITVLLPDMHPDDLEQYEESL